MVCSIVRTRCWVWICSWRRYFQQKLLLTFRLLFSLPAIRHPALRGFAWQRSWWRPCRRCGGQGGCPAGGPPGGCVSPPPPPPAQDAAAGGARTRALHHPPPTPAHATTASGSNFEILTLIPLRESQVLTLSVKCKTKVGWLQHLTTASAVEFDIQKSKVKWNGWLNIIIRNVYCTSKLVNLSGFEKSYQTWHYNFKLHYSGREWLATQ